MHKIGADEMTRAKQEPPIETRRLCGTLRSLGPVDRRAWVRGITARDLVAELLIAFIFGIDEAPSELNTFRSAGLRGFRYAAFGPRCFDYGNARGRAWPRGWR